jgi:hypothetical protein
MVHLGGFDVGCPVFMVLRTFSGLLWTWLCTWCMDLCGVAWQGMASYAPWPTWPMAVVEASMALLPVPCLLIGRLTRLFINATGRAFATHARFPFSLLVCRLSVKG